MRPAVELRVAPWQQRYAARLREAEHQRSLDRLTAELHRVGNLLEALLAADRRPEAAA